MNPDAGFGNTVRRLRRAQGRSIRELAAAIRYNQGSLSRIENGKRPPPLHIADALDIELCAHGQLAALARRPPVDPVDASADESLALADWLSLDSHRLTIDTVGAELIRISDACAHSDLHPLVTELEGLRARIHRVLHAGPPPRATRDLVVLAAATLDLLARITSTLGHPSAAQRHAHAAHTLATTADHDALRAWTARTQASIEQSHSEPAEPAQPSTVATPVDDDLSEFGQAFRFPDEGKLEPG